MPTFIKELPIYSVSIYFIEIAVYKYYIYLSGGGGGKTGIAN